MRFSRLLMLLLTTGLLGLPVLALSASAASAAESWETRILINRTPRLQVFKRTMVVVGSLDVYDPTSETWFNVDNGGGHDQTIALQRQRAGSDTYSTVDTQVADADGDVEFRVRVRSNAKYRLTYDGGSYDTDLALGPSTSAAKVSKVMRDLGARQPAAGGRHAVFKGNVNPGYRGRNVTLQRKTCKSCHWHNVSKDRTTRHGSWRFVIPAPPHGSRFYRTRTPSSRTFATSYSATLRVYRL